MPPSKIGLFRILNIDRKKFYLTDTKENKEKPLFFFQCVTIRMPMVGDKLGELKNQEKNTRLTGVINTESDEEVEICMD